MDILIMLLLYGGAVYFIYRKDNSNPIINQHYPENVVPMYPPEEENSIILPYRKKKHFFSGTERSFFEVLQFVLKDQNVIIFSKVRILDLLSLPKNPGQKQFYQNKFQSKYVDFLICDTSNYSPLLVIKLDDSSYLNFDRIKRNHFVNEVFYQANLPILRIPAQTSYNVQELSQQIQAHISNISTSTPKGS